jgi:peptide/nickel transport system substrate-binding protein
MKSNRFKYVFVAFVIAIMIFAIFKFRSEQEKQKAEQTQVQTSTEQKNTQITLGISSFDSMNPILSQNKNVQDISRLIYEPLISLTSDYKAEGCLAKEWAKQGTTSYLIKLKETIRWSDGEKFTADDVKFTIDKLKEGNSIYSSQVQAISSIDIVDDYTVKINLSEEVPFFEYQLTFPIMSSQYFLDKEFNPNIVPVGTGMYKVSDIQSSYLVLTKNESWWNTKVSLTLDKITVNLYSSIGEMYNTFKMGNLDMIATQNSNLQDYIGVIGYAAKEMKGREHDFLAFNTQNYFLSKTEVRKAISYSVDKANLISSIFNNRYEISSFPLDYGSWLYQEQNASLGYNPEQAKQILTENGWTFRNQYWQKTENYKTQKLTLNLLVKASDSTRVAVAQNIKAQLDAQGIYINIIQASNEQYNTFLTNKNYDIALCSMNLSISPNLTTFFGNNNLANYQTEETTNLMNEIKNTTDETIMKNDVKRLGEIYKNEAPYLSLYNNKFIVAYSTGLVGEVTPNWYNLFYHIEGWYK